MRPCLIFAVFLFALVGCADHHDNLTQALDPQPAAAFSPAFVGPTQASASSSEAPNLVSDRNKAKPEPAVPTEEAREGLSEIRPPEQIVDASTRNHTDTGGDHAPQEPRPASAVTPEQSQAKATVPEPAPAFRSDANEATGRYRRAAEQDSVAAQFRLGTAYYYGQGVPQDYKEAAAWYRKAAEQGSASAQFNLGIMYYRGQGVPRGYEEAAKWFTQAAEQGHPKAQFNMGVTYYDGQGVLEDYIEAYKWALLASMNGSVPARVLGDTLRRIMTPDQLDEAQRRARAFLGR